MNLTRTIQIPWDLMTLAEWIALPEDNSAHFELQEGVVVVAPKRGRTHQRALARIARTLDNQLPPGRSVVPSVEVVVRADDPAIVRVPDLVVIDDSHPDEELLTGAHVELAVEIISPGSRNLDLHLKPVEYAEAGIPHYWVVDLDPPSPSVTVFELGDLAVNRRWDVTGELVVTEPFTVRVDIAALVGPQ